MKTIIAGGRDYQLNHDDVKFLSSLLITEVVSGGATGADRGGEAFAQAKGIPIKVFKADWDKHGRAAGPIRNREMAQYADAVVLFPGGKGTASMMKEATRAGIIIYERRDHTGTLI
jgi:hypothetical protein